MCVFQVQNEGVSCEFCAKICKSKQGLNRHKAAKHKDQDLVTKPKSQEKNLSYNVLTGLVKDTIVKIVEREVFDKTLKDEVKHYSIEMSESSTEFNTIQNIYEAFLAKGNKETFYAKFYGEIALNSSTYFKGLSQRAATLLATKLADTLLSHAKQASSPTTIADKSIPISDIELAGLQYLGGYVLQRLHKRHRLSRHKATSESQQAIAILNASKQCTNENIENSQKLISCLNRGGLWSPTESAQVIFKRTEHHFRENTSKASQCIANELIIVNSVKDPAVTVSYNAILSNADLEISNSVGKDILYAIVSLYVRVRSFSFAKDIIQKYKFQQKQGKAKALRKELQRSSVDVEDRQN